MIRHVVLATRRIRSTDSTRPQPCVPWCTVGRSGPAAVRSAPSVLPLAATALTCLLVSFWVGGCRVCSDSKKRGHGVCSSRELSPNVFGSICLLDFQQNQKKKRKLKVKLELRRKVRNREINQAKTLLKFDSLPCCQNGMSIFTFIPVAVIFFIYLCSSFILFVRSSWRFCCVIYR